MTEAIVAMRLVGAGAMVAAAVVALMLWWRVRGLPNSALFLHGAASSIVAAVSVVWLAHVTADSQVAVLVANVAVAGAFASFAIIELLIWYQGRR